MIVFVDGDTVLYRAAFAAERTKYVLKDLETGEPIREFDSKKKLNSYLKDKEGWESLTHIEREVVLEPESHALQNTKSILSNIKDAVAKEFALPCEVEVYLSGARNFRKSISSFEMYKGNRKERKPAHLPALREYVVNYWNGQVCEGVEADDYLAVRSEEEDKKKGVICTTDKDLDQIEGWHYNFVKQEFYYVTSAHARRFFWEQMLIGDTVDNILGVRNIGPVKARSALSDCSDVASLSDKVRNIYIDAYGDEEGKQRFIENLQLLGLLRTRQEVQGAAGKGTQ